MAAALAGLGTALQDRYRLDRQLGQGGMATVYLAEDLKHHRQVAVKVLRPELAAALGAERFLLEIRTTANLRHPHILPLYDSGEADGFLFYVMPLVEGESLRDRLNREKQLPIDDALRIAGEVADALHYAHAHGVIHRDIKPENVLLESGHAVVADFGIARAVSAAGGERLTEPGLAIGTPAYMSPEQATGSTDIDARSDLYSLGCVLYEMLVGETPYTGPTPMAILARKLSEPLPRISVVRERVPPEVEEALVKVLARTPADRFATAAQFGETLSHAMTRPATDTARRRLGLWVLAAGLLLAVISAGAVWFFQTGGPGTLFAKGSINPGDRVLLADIANLTDDTTLAYAVSDGVRTMLADPRVVRLVDPANVRETLSRMGWSPETRLVDSVAREVAERESAKVFLAGEISRLGAGYQFTIRVVQTVDGVELLRKRVTASDSEQIIPALDRLGGQLRRAIGESMHRALVRPPLARVSTGSLPALRAYSEVMLRGGVALPKDQRLALIDQAIAQDSDFAMAWRRKGIELGFGPKGRAAFARAYLLRNRLPELERLVVTGSYFRSRRDFPAAEAAFREALSLDPGNDVAGTNLSDLLLVQRRWAEAETVAVRQLDAVSRLVGLTMYQNAVEAQWAQRRFAAAESTLAGAVKKGVLGWQGLRAHVLLARRDYRGVFVFADSLWHAPGRDSVIARQMRDHYLFAARLGSGHLRDSTFPNSGANVIWVGLRYTADTARAIAGIDQWLRLRGWDTIPPARRLAGGIERLGWLLAETGRPREAQQLLNQYIAAAQTDSNLAFTLPTFRSGLEGAIAMAEGRFRDAATAFLAWHAAPFLSETHPFNRGLAEAGAAMDHLGATDSARTLYELALSQSAFLDEFSELPWYPLVLRRLGELYAARGERQRAADYYTKFIDLWRDADPELQPQVRAARAARARLTAEPRGR